MGFAKRVKDDKRRQEAKGKGKCLAFLSSLFCSPCLSAIKLSFHFIKSLLNIQYVLGTLLDAGNTKMKIKTKQNKNKTASLLTSPPPDLRQIWLEPGKLPLRDSAPGHGVQHALLSRSLQPCLPSENSLDTFSKLCISHLPEQLSPAGRISFWMKNPKLGEQFWLRRESCKGTCSVSLEKCTGTGSWEGHAVEVRVKGAN